jgi:hypothetical protein
VKTPPNAAAIANGAEMRIRAIRTIPVSSRPMSGAPRFGLMCCFVSLPGTDLYSLSPVNVFRGTQRDNG